MRLTGHLFRLRRDVVLIGNVLDVPDMFWEEASLRGLYDGVREYFEIGQRVRSVEERVAGARGLVCRLCVLLCFFELMRLAGRNPRSPQQ